MAGKQSEKVLHFQESGHRMPKNPIESQRISKNPPPFHILFSLCVSFLLSGSFSSLSLCFGRKKGQLKTRRRRKRKRKRKRTRNSSSLRDNSAFRRGTPYVFGEDSNPLW